MGKKRTNEEVEGPLEGPQNVPPGVSAALVAELDQLDWRPRVAVGRTRDDWRWADDGRRTTDDGL